MADRQNNSAESANNIIDVLYVVRQGKRVDWVENDPTLNRGEVGLAIDYPGCYLVGDGKTPYSAIPWGSSFRPYITGTEQAGSVKVAEEEINRAELTLKPVRIVLGAYKNGKYYTVNPKTGVTTEILENSTFQDKVSGYLTINGIDPLKILNEKITANTNNIADLKNNLFIIWGDTQDEKIVDGHPDIAPSETTSSIYLVPISEDANEYIEWVCEEGAWRKLSETTVSITYIPANINNVSQIGDINADSFKNSDGTPKKLSIQDILNMILSPNNKDYTLPTIINKLNTEISNRENKDTEILNKLVGKKTSSKGEIFNVDSGKSGCAATGIASHAEGVGGNASGLGAHKEGSWGQATGDNAHTEGNNSKAIGAYSHSEGSTTQAKGNGSHSEGYNAIAEGNESHAEGNSTLAKGAQSHSEGLKTQATGARAHSEGSETIASGQDSHAEGQNTVVDGIQSHVEGRSSNKAVLVENSNWQEKNRIICENRNSKNFSYVANTAAHGEGYDTLSLGNSSHAEGRNTRATHDFTHAEGYGSIVTGPKSHVEGGQSSVFGYACHGEGLLTQVGTQGGTWHQSKVSNLVFEKEGTKTRVYIELTEKDNLDIFSTEKKYDILLNNTSQNLELAILEKTVSSNGFPRLKCSGNNLDSLSQRINNGSIGSNEIVYLYSENCVAAHAEGKDTQALHSYSHTSGLGTKSSRNAQTVVGQYNLDNEDALFIVGSGTNSNTRRNAIEVRDIDLQVENAVQAKKIELWSVGISERKNSAIPITFFDEQGFHIDNKIISWDSFKTKIADNFFDSLEVNSLIVDDKNVEDILTTHGASIYENTNNISSLNERVLNLEETKAGTKMVETLPEISEASTSILYLVPTQDSAEGGNSYGEYIVVEEEQFDTEGGMLPSIKKWEKIGETKISGEIDLGNYYNKEEINKISKRIENPAYLTISFTENNENNREDYENPVLKILDGNKSTQITAQGINFTWGTNSIETSNRNIVYAGKLFEETNPIWIKYSSVTENEITYRKSEMCIGKEIIQGEVSTDNRCIHFTPELCQIFKDGNSVTPANSATWEKIVESANGYDNLVQQNSTFAQNISNMNNSLNALTNKTSTYRNISHGTQLPDTSDYKEGDIFILI